MSVFGKNTSDSPPMTPLALSALRSPASSAPQIAALTSLVACLHPSLCTRDRGRSHLQVERAFGGQPSEGSPILSAALGGCQGGNQQRDGHVWKCRRQRCLRQ